MTTVRIVTGPPGAGKTSWVKSHLTPGDLVVDVDAIFTALSGLPWYEKPAGLLPIALDVRDMLLERVQKRWGLRDIPHVWVITTEANVKKLKRMKRKLKAKEVLIFAVNPHECLRRISQDDRRKHKYAMWQPMINKWWDTYENSKVISDDEYDFTIA